MVARDEPSLVVDANTDPGTLFLLGHGVEKFSLEAFGELDLIRCRLERRDGIPALCLAGEDVTPRAISHLSVGNDFCPTLLSKTCLFPLPVKFPVSDPSGIGYERFLFTRLIQSQLHDESPYAPLVDSFHGNGVFLSRLKKLLNFSRVVASPVVS